MADRQEVMKVMRVKGPVLPVHIAKAFETSILFASAMLSDLVSVKLAKVSSVKIGGSPLYYLPEQKERLQEFAKHLKPKEKEAYELLKKEKVLKDAEQAPGIRVALRNIKDFSWPLQVSVNSNKEIFWKWYLISNEEAGDMIKEKLGVKKGAQDSGKPENAGSSGGKTNSHTEKIIAEEKNRENLIEEKEKIVQDKEVKIDGSKTENANEQLQKKEEGKEPEQFKNHEVQKQKNDLIENKEEKISDKNELNENKIKIKEEESEKEETEKKQEQQKEEKNSKTKEPEFLWQILDFFSENNIKVLNKEVIRKNELDFIIEMQSAVGKLKYYCKAKAKQRIGDGDLSSAYVQGQLKKLPVLFLTYGEPTKKASEMLGKEFENIVFKKI